MTPKPESPWALIRGSSYVVRRYRRSWRQRKPEHSKPWAVTLAIGFAALIVLASAASLTGRYYSNRGLDAWDLATLQKYVDSSPISFQDAVVMQGLGATIVVLPLAVAGALVAIWLRKPLTALAFLACFFLQKLILFWGWTLWDRTRPDIVADGIAVPSLRAYPSGHMMQTVPIYGLLAFLWITASRSTAERILVALATLSLYVVVGASRLRMGAHWVSDVIAGASLGAAWLLVIIIALRQTDELRR